MIPLFPELKPFLEEAFEAADVGAEYVISKHRPQSVRNGDGWQNANLRKMLTTIFKRADVVIITKTDLAAATCFDRAAALESIGHVAPQARVFELSTRAGTGLSEWYAYLERLLADERTERMARRERQRPEVFGR